MHLSHLQFVSTFTFLLTNFVTSDDVESDLMQETRTYDTFSSRSSPGRSRVVTGTFRFRRVTNHEDAAKYSSGKASGWDIEGCYCDTGTRCSCNGNRNRVRMFVRTGSKSPPMPGSMGIPLPPVSMFDGPTTEEQGPSEPPQPNNSDESIETESERLVRRPSSNSNRSGCLCNSNGCSGNDCSTMNGCVCSQGACWGAACDSRIPITGTPQQSTLSTSGNLMSSTSSTSSLPSTNSMQLVRNALFAASPVVSVNGSPTNQPQQNSQLQQQQQQQQQVSNNAVIIGDCSCNNLGCTGSGCANMNGCFCIGSNCWGNSCNINSLLQTSSNLVTNALQTGQIQLPNLSGRLNVPNGQLALPTGQLNNQLTLPTGQINLPGGQVTLNNGQTANLLDIPGLTGPGGILSSLIPGGFGGGGGASNPFGMPAAGGGNDLGGQAMQVLKGIPVKRLTASRAKRIRGQLTRVKPGMELAATRGRIRPSHTVRKRIRPIQSTDETSQTLVVSPDPNSLDPFLSMLQLNQLSNEDNHLASPANLTTMDETIHFDDSSLGDPSIEQEPEESMNLFTFTDSWL